MAALGGAFHFITPSLGTNSY